MKVVSTLNKIPNPDSDSDSDSDSDFSRNTNLDSSPDSDCADARDGKRAGQTGTVVAPKQHQSSP